MTKRLELYRRVDGQLGHPARLSAERITGFLGRPDWSRSTRRTYYSGLMSLYEFMVATGRVRRSPMAGIRPVKVPRNMPRPASLEAFIQLSTQGPDRFRLATLLAGYAGLRCCEIVALRRQEVTAQEITVLSGKGGKSAQIPTHENVWAAVRDRPGGLLIRKVRGSGAYLPGAFSSQYGNHAERMGWPGVALHRFRHLFATQVYTNTRDLLVTQQLLRHASPSTTAIYAQVTSGIRRAAVDTLNLGDATGGAR